MKRSLLVLLALVLPACHVVVKPCTPACSPGSTCVAGVCLPTQPPPPTNQCPDGQTWCDAQGGACIPVGATCGPYVPPPVCPSTCPRATRCTDPTKGCEPIPAPGPVCVAGQVCGCYHLPPDAADWLLATCPGDQTCSIDHVCVSVGPPPGPVETTPTAADCPLIPPAAAVYINDKPAGHGQDSTVRVKDRAFCEKIYGPGVVDCHMEGLGQPGNWRCSWFLAGGCPVWQYSVDQKVAAPCVDDHNTPMSCDHFGTPSAQDDPQTHDIFEGRPAICGLQRNELGPIAGFFTVAHGAGYVRACLPNAPSVCGPWVHADH